MNYPTTVYDSYGAQQLPKEREEVKDECIKNHIEQTDYFDNIIQPNDRVFELVFRIYEPNDELQSVMIYTVTEIVTQSTISELIDKLGSENLISIEHLGLGKEIYGG